MRSCVLALLVGCAATRAPRIDIVLNTERRSISELAAENGFTTEGDPLNEVVVGLAATFAVRTCFPTDEAFATVWMRMVSVEQVGDTARVSLLRGSGGRPRSLSPNYGAGDGIRTRDVNLGKVALYH
jgi:hypothetical protein